MVKNIGITGVSGFIGGTASTVIGENNRFVIHKLRRDNDRYNAMTHYDAIIHCGEQSEIAVVNSMTEQQMKTSIDQTKELIKSTKHFVYLSSSAVYPKNLQRAAKLNDARPTDRYTERKMEIEAEVGSRNGTVLRLSNVFGKNMSQSNIFNDVYAQLHKSEVSVKNKSAERDYVHVLDVIDIIEHIISNNVRGLFNVSSGQVYTVTEIVELMFRNFNKPLKTIYSLNQDTPDSLYLDCYPLNSRIRGLEYRSLSNYIRLDFQNE